MKKSAFTLIELLVVIVIIGILASFGAAQFNDYQVKARLAKAQAFASQLTKVMEAKSAATATPKTFAYTFEGDVNQDLSIQNNDLNCASSTTSTDTPYGIGRSLVLNSTTGARCLRTTNTKNLPSGNLTISFWLKPGSVSSHLVRTSRFFILYSSINEALQFGVGERYGSMNSFNKNLQDGSWHHIAATYGGSALKLYLDGNLVDTVEASIPEGQLIYSEIIELGYPANTDILMDDVYLWPIVYEE